MPEPLVEFVKSCLERGLPRSEIARALEAGGWSHRAARADSAARIAPLYRILASLSLLVTALVMAGDLVCVIVGFLAGDLTLRFVLEGLVVLLLAGGIYLWYSIDMHREEAIADATYTLTATFDLASPPDRDSPRWERDGFFTHGAGEQTFRLSVPKR